MDPLESEMLKQADLLFFGMHTLRQRLCSTSIPCFCFHVTTLPYICMQLREIGRTGMELFWWLRACLLAKSRDDGVRRTCFVSRFPRRFFWFYNPWEPGKVVLVYVLNLIM